MEAWRRIADHPTTRVSLLILAGAQAMIGAFILGLAVNIGTSSVAAPADPGPFPLTATSVAGIGGTPQSIVVTADGSLWFAASNPPAIGRVDPAGNVSHYPTRVPWGPGAVAARSDGGVWYADTTGAAIGFVTSSGAMGRYAIGAAGNPRGLTVGPDGNVWFTFDAEGGGWIGRMTPTGDVSRFLLPPQRSEPRSIVAGPDGNLWFAMSDALGRITPGGQITDVALGVTSGTPTLTAGPDKAIWFARNTEDGGASVGRVEVGAVPRITAVYDLPEGAGVDGIVAGADGNLWVAEKHRQAIARVSTRGQVTQYDLVAGEYPEAMVAGSDDRLLFTFHRPGTPGGVGRFDLPVSRGADQIRGRRVCTFVPQRYTNAHSPAGAGLRGRRALFLRRRRSPYQPVG